MYGTYGYGAGDEDNDTPFIVRAFRWDVDEVFDYMAGEVEGACQIEAYHEVPQVKRVKVSSRIDELDIQRRLLLVHSVKQKKHQRTHSRVRC